MAHLHYHVLYLIMKRRCLKTLLIVILCCLCIKCDIYVCIYMYVKCEDNCFYIDSGLIYTLQAIQKNKKVLFILNLKIYVS